MGLSVPTVYLVSRCQVIVVKPRGQGLPLFCPCPCDLEALSHL